MGFEMSRLRKEDLSLYYYIKDSVLSCFVEKEELISLVCMPELSTSTSVVYETNTTMEPSPVDRGRGWVYFDTVTGTNAYQAPTDPCAPATAYCSTDDYIVVSGTRADGVDCFGTPEQDGRVVVYDSDFNIIPNTSYIVDYIDGRVVTSGTVTPVYVDYHWNYISVVDEWSAIEASDAPVVVIDMSETKQEGYQLGGGKKIIRKVDLHVFGGDPAERNDIVDALYNGLYIQSCPLYDFPTGGVLDYDGTFFGRKNNPNKLTSLFSRETFSGSSRLQFEEVVSRHVNLPLVMTRTKDEVLLSDLNAYRSKVTFNVVSYT